MLPAAYISHVSSGRLRIRIPAKRNSGEYFSRIQKTLQALDRSVQVEVTALTASVLIKHRTDLVKILDCAKQQKLFDCKETVQSSSKDLSKLPDLMRRDWVPKVILGLGALQVLRGQPLAPSSTLFMDAYRLWIANRPPAA